LSGPAASERRPVPGIDPRIRARRIAVRRTEGRRRLHWLGAVGVAGAVATTALGVALSPLLDVDVVRVEGAIRAGRANVLAATDIDRGDPLLTLDLAAAEAGVQALPWVADATVLRSWGGSVSVEVVERTPVAGLAEPDGRVALVDADGHVLDHVPNADDGVIPIEGLEGGLLPGDQVAGPARAAIALAAGIPAELRPRVVRMVVGAAGQLDLELVVEEDEPPALVHLGDGSQLAEKLRALVTMVASADLSDLAVLDLEVPGAPALTRR
jgi:cell division protein FtsQ